MILSLIFLLTCTPTALLDFAIPKWKADDAIRIEDTYKWLFQATRGGEHAAPSRETAKQWLEREWSMLGEPDKNEPVWEPLCPDGEIGRVNLRPFKKQGESAVDILDAFLASSTVYRATVDEFTAAWVELEKRLKKKPFGKITLKEWRRLDAEMKPKGYPAVHHSANYNTVHKPAYRIITMSEWRKLEAPR